MNKSEAKQQIAKLVEKYQRVAEAGKIKSYNEAQTRNEFIEPLFEFLGWDMRNLTTDGEVTTEENISGDRVDLAFRFNNIPVMFLEAKAMKVDLDEWKWAEQAINYSWNKSVTWAILTDFESIKVFNAEVPPKGIKENLFFEIKISEYLDQFDQLWLLSKESFEQKLLDKEAQKWGKLAQRKQVGEKLFEDLMAWRLLLTKDFKKQNDLTGEVLDEGIQRILDRLIFIRTTEDRKIEPNVLSGILRGGKPHLYKQLIRVFRDFDDGFNSKLFALHFCESWEVSDETIGEVINGLYETRDGYRYDFSAISADVLGGMYEQYLGYVQGRKSEEKQKSNRKSQGIYYTPKYIVEFIVKETLGEVLKKTKPKDLSKIKILDPACGSGSFLTAAYDKIFEKIKTPNLFTQFEILKDNIFGVDLDAQAVEIAQLNLLLKVLHQKTKLPTLQHNINSGNSLVSGAAEELEKYFGLDYRKQRPFNFESEFKEVFDQGGFDVIVGNPPYVRNTELLNNDKEFFNKNYLSAYKQYDIFILFFEKSLKLLKNRGYLGFITSNKFMASDYGKKLRDILLNNCKIISLIDVSHIKIFKDASTYPVITIVQKENRERSRMENIIRFQKIDEIKDLNIRKSIIEIKQSKFIESECNSLSENVGGKKNQLIKKIDKDSIKIKEFFICRRGSPKNKIKIISERIKDSSICISPRDVNKYLPKISNNIFVVSNLQDNVLAEEKILMPRTTLNIKAAYETGNNFIMDRIYYLISKSDKKINLKFVTGILNSTLLNFYYKMNFETTHVGGGYLDLRGTQIEQLPIKLGSEAQQQFVIKLVDRMLVIYRELQTIAINTDRYNSLKQVIEKLDHEIDEAIYKLYGLTNEEIKIVEGK